MPSKKVEAVGTAALVKTVEGALSAVRGLREELEQHGLASKTPDERKHSTGKLRDGEEEAMRNVLDAVDKFPGIFASLAPHDHGTDDKKVETAPARAALDRRALLAPLARELEALLDRVNDDMLESAEVARDVSVPAYAIVKANEKIAPDVRKAAAPALTFYAATSKRTGKKNTGE